MLTTLLRLMPVTVLVEAWLFGKLQTVGASEAETRAETAAMNVAATYTDETSVYTTKDILSLTRISEGAWLFGKLQTVGASEAETRAETKAVNVAATYTDTCCGLG